MKAFFRLCWCAGLLMAFTPLATAQFMFIPAGAADWRYLDNGSDQGTAWQAPGFDDLSWSTGTAQFGYGDGDEVTVVSYGPDPLNKYITTYFRKSFWVTNTAQWSNLTLRVLRDDGAVVYLNGTEVNRQNMPSGPVSYQTLALTAVNEPDESTFFETSVSPALLVNGQNTVAVELHQANVASSDLGFDLQLLGSSSAAVRPTIITQPQSQTAPEGSDVTFSVVATGTEPLRYRWRRNGITLPGATNSSLTLFSVTSSNAGNYTVVVTNIAGSVLSSNAVLTVTPTSTNLVPTVNLIRPTNGATFPAGSGILLTASATDSDGTVSFVEFFANNTLLAQVTSSTNIYNFVWSNAPAGTFQVRAEAVDNAGGRGISASAQITVTGGSTNAGFPLISAGSVWRYRDDGSDQGTAWQAPGFDDSTWASGPAQLGYGDGDESTVVGFGPDPFAKFITTYFRRQFIVTNAAQWTNIVVRLLRDDGGVVYLNGTEVARQNMPAGPIDYQTLAAVTVNAPEESAFFEQPVSPGLLVSGLNTIAVEIHQVNPSSSDISFDLELIAMAAPAAVRPTIITHPQSQPVPEGSDVTFSVVATGTEPLRYRWRRNGITLPGATNSSLTLFSVTSSNAGSYSVIVTNIAGFALSSNAVLTVISSNNQPPVVTLTSPTNGSVFLFRRPIILRAQASDPDGTVSFVDFFANTTRVARAFSTTGTFTSIWSNAPAGTFDIRAVATDNQAAQGISQVATITVLSNRPPTALDQAVTVTEDSSTPITLTGTDPDGDFLTFTVLTLPARGILSGTAPFLTYTPAPNYFGPDSFTFSVRDREFQSGPATVQITVSAVNDAPLALIDVENAITFLDRTTIITLDAESSAVVLDGSRSFDLESDPLEYTWLVGDPPTAFASGVHVVGDFPAGSYVFQLQVSDGDLTGTANAFVDVLTPCDAIALLIARIEESSHPNSIKRPLIDSLEMACDDFDKGKLEKGIEGLEAFQDKVDVRLGEVDPVFAELLINESQTLIDAIPTE
jgi:hypothetical protein